MANHKSAAKRHRQSLKRRERNITQRSAFRTAVKKVVNMVSVKDAAASDSVKTDAAQALKAATRLLDKAAVHGIIHKNTARRKISRLATRVNSLG